MTIKKRKKNSIHLIYFKVKFDLDSWNAWYIYEFHSWGTRLSLSNPASHSGLGYKGTTRVQQVYNKGTTRVQVVWGTIFGVQSFPLVIQLTIVFWDTRVQQGSQQGYSKGTGGLGYNSWGTRLSISNPAHHSGLEF